MSRGKLFVVVLLITRPFLCQGELTIANNGYSEDVVFDSALELLGWDPRTLEYTRPSAAESIDSQELLHAMVASARSLGLRAEWVKGADMLLDLSRGPIIFANAKASLAKRKAIRDEHAKRTDPDKWRFRVPGADSCFFIAVAIDAQRQQVYLKYGGNQGTWYDRDKVRDVMTGTGLRIVGRASNPGAKVWTDMGVARASVAAPESELTLINVGSVPLQFANTGKSNAAIQIELSETALAPRGVARIPIRVSIDPNSNSGFIGAVSLAVVNSPDVLANFTVFENIDKERRAHLQSIAFLPARAN